MSLLPNRTAQIKGEEMRKDVRGGVVVPVPAHSHIPIIIPIPAQRGFPRALAVITTTEDLGLAPYPAQSSTGPGPGIKKSC